MRSLRVSILLLSLCAVGAFAGQVPLPIHIPGGNDSRFFDLANNNAAINGVNALGFDDGVLGIRQDDAYDGFGGIAVQVGATILPFNTTGDVVSANGNLITAGPETLNGLNVTVQYYIDPHTATWRTLATFNNPTGADIASIIAWGGNVGSDGDSQFPATSDGDTTFTIADRWTISSEKVVETPADPINTFVYSGPGTPAITLNAIAANFIAGNDLLDVRYNLTVPAGQTRSLLFFVQMNYSLTEAKSASAVFDSNSALLNAGLLAGLTQADLSLIANWDFSALTIGNVDSFVWHDLNGNGIQDAGEPGIFGVTVRLLNASGATVQTTKSDLAGLARFSVAPGNYTLAVDHPAGFKFSAKDQGSDDAVDSDVATADGHSASFTVATLTDTIDAGLIEVEQAAFGTDLSTLYRVYTASGLFSVVADTAGRRVTGLAMDPTDGTLFAITKAGGTNPNSLLTVNKTTGALTLVGALSASTPFLDIAFDANGQLFGFSSNANNLFTINKTTGVVTLVGASGLGTTRGDGLAIDSAGNVFVAPEGISGRLITLNKSTGKVSGLTTLDGPNFTLDAVQYDVNTMAYDSAGNLYAVFFFNDEGSNSNLVRIDPLSGHVTTLGALMPDFDSLAFDVTPGSLPCVIGNKVWNDTNANGILDNGETGVAGVTVNLLDGGVTIQSTVSDAAGGYSFAAPAGTYVVQFVAPFGMDLSPQDRGTDDAADSDADVTTGNTASITLAAAQNITNVDAGVLTPVKVTVTSATGASSNNVVVGEVVTFNVAATDPNGNPLTITWDFGDGTTGTGATATHAYTTPGVFIATATITNGTLGGTTTSSTSVSVTALPMLVNKIGVKLSFSKPNTDAISFGGVLQLPAGTTVAGQTAIVNFGGVTKIFTLDSKGGAKSGKDSIKISVKGNIAQNAKFAVKLNGDFKTALADEGFDNANNTRKTVVVHISLTIGTSPFATVSQMFYKSKASSGGAAKALKLPK